MNPFENLSHGQVSMLDDASLLKMLLEAWEMEEYKEIQVLAEIKKVGNDENSFVVLRNIRHPESGELIEYPISGVASIQEKSPFIPPESGRNLLRNHSNFIKCNLELSPLLERKKHNNQLLLNMKKGSAEEFLSLKQVRHHTVWTDDEMAYISRSVFDHFIRSQKPFIEAEIEQTKKELDSESDDLRKLISGQKTELDQIISQFKKTEKLALVEQETKERIESKIKDLEDKQIDLIHQIAEHQLTEAEMAKKLEKLKTYISNKASLLKQLEFIDDDEFSAVFDDSHDDDSSIPYMDFKLDFNGDYKYAVSYIQAYLLKRDILYPRHIIENFFALIRANDLIILAGDSGSGKTNLVQSFAKAVGGVAKIIPVKPNWTSSEDLLGYYNPLEKKYLATPFLEALIEARDNPDTPYFICLDELNLARVEYYFADFLSKLEQRDSVPNIQLYSDNESAHVLSELKNVIQIITDSREKYQKGHIVDFVKLMQDDEVNAEMKRSFGFGDKESLIKYHTDIRRMLSGVLGIPSSIDFPSNVRIIGAINIDETTHYLSPKILDRVHIMKFQSPLLTNWEEIHDEVSKYEFEIVDIPLKLTIDELGERKEYPRFDLESPFCQLFMELNRDFFHPLGIEFGMRTIRQGLNFLEAMNELGVDYNLTVNNFILHKVLPKMHFDGSKEVSSGVNKIDLLNMLKLKINQELDFENIPSNFSSLVALDSIIDSAKTNDDIVNYWS